MQIDTEKIIQYEMMSKGSERPMSMQGGTDKNGGVGTSNSIMVSGTPTEISIFIGGQPCVQTVDNTNPYFSKQV